MDDGQRRALEENLVSFCENLDLTEVLPYLQAKGYLRDHHVESITNQKTTYDRRYELIKLIKTRGPAAYSVFYDALMHSNQEHLAELLAPHLKRKLSNGSIPEDPSARSRSPSPDPIVYPANTHLLAHPKMDQLQTAAIQENISFYKDELRAYSAIAVSEPSGILTDLSVEMVDGNSSTVSSFDPENMYPNFSNPKGLALIINNRRFRGRIGLPERLGTDVDEVNMTRTLQQIGYKVKVKKDLSAAEMMSAMYRFAQKSEHKTADSTVVVVLTHGESGELFGSDEYAVSVDHFLATLNAANCFALRHKPKLFFLQACRGKRYDAGHFHDSIDVADGNGNGNGNGDGNGNGNGTGARADGNSFAQLNRQLNQCRSMDDTDANDLRQKLKVPLEADFLVAYATTPGYVSWRNSMKGTWFIQSICEIFARHAHKEDILSMLTMVNRQVAHAFQSSGDGFKQIPEPTFRLTRKFFFFPGYYRTPM
uniref:Uncharacterized protein n=1 Tax=Plectus sambesii TaxID=2011161 RepID=A0A914W2P5_9BILA